MNVTIVGYGGMGHEIERALLERNHRIVARVDPEAGAGDAREIDDRIAKDSQMVIEFAAASGVVENAACYCARGLPAVVGTTGWESSRAEVKAIVEKGGTAYLWGSNFSIGAHIFFNLVELAARFINPFPQYDIMVLEMHHGKKKDSPSGTALSIGERILHENSRKKRIVDTKLDRKIAEDELHIASLRGGSSPGVHTVYVDSPADTIELIHTARSRSGLAMGAVLAAEWLVGKRGFFQVEDFIREKFE